MQKQSHFMHRLLAFWTLKRQSRNGVPLLRRLTTTYAKRNINYNNASPSANKKKSPEDKKKVKKEKKANVMSARDKLREEIKYWQRLRQDLERARLLCELIRKREKTKRELIKVKTDETLMRLSPFVHLLLQKLDQLQDIDAQHFFAEPVDFEEVMDYLSIIKHPMDLSTMRQKVQTHQYHSVELFEADFNLMVENCLSYNAKDTVFYRAALKMKDLGGAVIRQLKRDVDYIGFDLKTGLLLPRRTKLPPEICEQSIINEVDTYMNSSDIEDNDIPLQEKEKRLLELLDKANLLRQPMARIKRVKSIRLQISKVRRKLSRNSSEALNSSRNGESSMESEEESERDESDIDDSSMLDDEAEPGCPSRPPSPSLPITIPLPPTSRKGMSLPHTASDKKTPGGKEIKDSPKQKKIDTFSSVDKGLKSSEELINLDSQAKLIKKKDDSCVVSKRRPGRPPRKSLNQNVTSADLKEGDLSPSPNEDEPQTSKSPNPPNSPPPPTRRSSMSAANNKDNLDTTNKPPPSQPASSPPAVEEPIKRVGRHVRRASLKGPSLWTDSDSQEPYPTSGGRKRKKVLRTKTRRKKEEMDFEEKNDGKEEMEEKKKEENGKNMTEEKEEKKKENIDGESGNDKKGEKVDEKEKKNEEEKKEGNEIEEDPSVSKTDTSSSPKALLSDAISMLDLTEAKKITSKESFKVYRQGGELNQETDEDTHSESRSSRLSDSESESGCDSDSNTDGSESASSDDVTGGDSSGGVPTGGQIPLEPLDLVWAKCRGYPWYPALIINPKMPRTGYFHNHVPIPVPPDEVLAHATNYTTPMYLVLFFDHKRTWQWLPRNKLEPLGVNSALDKAKLVESRKPAERKAVKKAYEKAILHRCKVTGENAGLSGDSETEATHQN